MIKYKKLYTEFRDMRTIKLQIKVFATKTIFCVLCAFIEICSIINILLILSYKKADNN